MRTGSMAGVFSEAEEERCALRSSKKQKSSCFHDTSSSFEFCSVVLETFCRLFCWNIWRAFWRSLFRRVFRRCLEVHFLESL